MNNYFLCICSRISVLDENTLLNLWGAAILFSKVITPSAPPPSWEALIISDVSCALANPHCCLFCLPILVCLCSYDLFAGVLNATPTTVVPLGQLIRLPLAIFYEELRVKVPSLRTELGTFLDSSFSPLCPVLTTKRQYWSWTGHGNTCAVHSTQSQMSWPHRTFALSLPSPDNWSHGWGHPCYLSFPIGVSHGLNCQQQRLHRLGFEEAS